MAKGKQIGKAHISVVADLNTDKAQKQLDELTKPKEVDISPKINTKKVFGDIQKILDKPVKRLTDAFDFRELAGQVKTHIDSISKSADRSLVASLQATLDDFQARFDNVSYHMVSGEVIHGYDAAIKEVDKLLALNAAQKASAETVQEVVSRISKNSSINGIKDLKQEAIDTTRVLSEMYDAGIRDTERYITLQYKLKKIFDALGKSYGGVKHSGAGDSYTLMQWVADGIAQQTGINIFQSNEFSKVIDSLFGNADFSLFNKSLSGLGMKHIADLLLTTGKTGDWVDMQTQVAVEVEKTADAVEHVVEVSNTSNVASNMIKSYDELRAILRECEHLASQIVKHKVPNIISLVEGGMYKPINQNYLTDESLRVSLITDAWNEYKKLDGVVDSTNESLIKAREKVVALAVDYARFHKDLSSLNNKELESFADDYLKRYDKAKRDEEVYWGRHGSKTKHNDDLLFKARLLKNATLYDNQRAQIFSDSVHQKVNNLFESVITGGAKANDVLEQMVNLMGVEIPGAVKNGIANKNKYYEIDEKAAKVSKQMRSFDDYKEGSATASYRATIDEMAKIVEEKKKQFPDKADKLDQILDRYAKNLAQYINRDNQIGAQYPSVMISGAGNYNIKKHDRQMASWGKNYQFYDDKVLSLENKIKNFGSSASTVIRGDEEDALERLEAKVEYMKYWHQVMVEANKYYKKNKTLDGFEGAEPDELERIKKSLADVQKLMNLDTPFPSYTLTNDSQNIKRLEGRVSELKNLKNNADNWTEENEIYKLWADKKDMRIRISFEMGKPDQEVIDMLRGKAFKWSPKNNAWQRQLTNNAVYETKLLRKSLHAFYNIEKQSKSATAAIEAQTAATEKLAEANKKVNDAATRTKSSSIKVREWESQDAYNSHSDQYASEHDGTLENLENVIDIVPRIGKDFNRIAADMTTSCKKAETAVKRFFSAIDPNKYPELAEWKGIFEESMQNGIFGQSDTVGGWAWEVQALDDNTYYVNVIAVTEAIKEQTEATEKLIETRLKLTPKKDGSGEYTAMDGKYEIGQDAEGWKVFQRDNAGLWNLIGTYQHFEDVKKDASLLTREEIVYTEEVVQEIKALQEAYTSLDTKIKGHMPVVNAYTDMLNKVKTGALSSADAIKQLNEVAGVKGLSSAASDTIARTNAMAEFAKANAEVVIQNQNSESFMKKYKELAQGILSGEIGLEKANKLLQDFITTLSEAVSLSDGLSKMTFGSSGETLAGTKPINFKYAVMSVEDLVMSHDAYGNVNSKYPEELQPRDRTRMVSRVQIEDIAKNIIPELLAASPTAQNGSPIVSNDGVVVGGNARSAALSKAYEAGRADGYKSYITEHASEFGLDPNNMPKNPVLVRVVDIDGGLDVLAKQLNESTTAGYSASEQAIVNEELIMKVISKLNIDESANLNSEANRDFVKSFISLLPENQKNEMMTKDGSLSAVGLVKVKQALASAAYGSKEMLENLEQISPELLNISNALMAGAAKAANIRYAVESGELNDLGVVSTLLNGVDLLKTARHGNQSIEDYMNQLSLFGSDYSAEDIAIGKFLEANIRNATQLKNMVDMILDSAMDAGDPNQLSFGGLGEVTLSDLIRSAFTRYASEYQKNIDYDALVGDYAPAEIGSRSDKRIDRTNDVSLDEFNQRAKEIYDNLRKHMSLLDASSIVGDITKSVNENTMSIAEGMQLLEERYASWESKHIELSSKTAEASDNIKIFNNAIKEQLSAVAGNADAIKEYSEILSEISSGAIGATDAINRMQNALGKYDNAPGDVGFVPYRMDQQQALSIVNSKVDNQTVEKWYLSKAEHQVRDQLGQLAMSDDELRNATLNLLFDAYVSRGGKLSFHDFVNSDTTIYRGTSKQNEQQSASGTFTSFTLDQGIAQDFATNFSNRTGDQIVVAFETKIKDVVGLFTDSLKSELEVFVPRDKVGNMLLGGEPNISSVIEESLQAKKEQAQLAEEATQAAEAQAAAEEKVAEAAKKAANAFDETKASNNVSVEDIIERNINEALSQLRSAKDNETTLFTLKGVFEGEDLVEQAQSMIQKIADQSNLSVANFTVKDDIIKVKLYNDELKVTVDQIYKLRAATEDMDSAQLELFSQSFSQNVKALNENNFDVDGIQQRALAAVEKVRSSLHGLEYDLTGLESAAKNISSQDDFNKFNNQLKAAQDNIQAIKNATVSKSSMNPFANMRRDMQNASIEIETMRLKLEKFGDIEGVAEAEKMLTDMVSAAEQYNKATDAQGQQSAYNQYSNLRSSFKAQTEYINAAKALNDSQKSEAKQADPIREKYQSILDLVNKINSVNTNILKYQGKDNGSGMFAGYIEQLQSEKSRLVSELNGITDELNNTLGSGFVQGKEFSVPSASFLSDSGAISSFLNDTRAQASLTADEIERLVAALQKSQNIDINAATKITEQFKSVQETYNRLSNLTGLDQSNANYQSLSGLLAQIMQYKNQLSADPTSWTPEQSSYLQSLIDQFTKYGNALADVGEKEAKYFAGKQKYTQGTTFGAAIQSVSEETKQVNDIRKQLEDAARAFAQDSGMGDAFITGFTQGADGISKLDFSAFDTATGSLRNFRMEMGSVTEGMYVAETTISKSLANIQAAQKQLQSVGGLLGRLDASGVSISEDNASSQVYQLLSLYKQLSAEISRGDAADQNLITKLTKDLRLASSETEKYYKQMIQMESAIASGEAKDLGVGDPKGKVYEQLVGAAQQLIGTSQNVSLEFGRFDEKTNTLNASLVHANGTVENFKVSMNGLNGQMAAQQSGVGKLTSTWDTFKASVSKAGRQFIIAFAGYNVFYKAISEVRKGINYVKEIDLALTELKKVTDENEASYAKFLDTAAGTAGKIGSTLSDFTEATANFARLGYTMEESASMAETAIVYKNVADGLDTVDEATDSIISTMKAFGIESNDTMGIIDRFNEVGVICRHKSGLKRGISRD